MGKVNGSTLLVYLDGVEVACQLSCGIDMSRDLQDTSCKQSNGWAEHMSGTGSGSFSCESLFSTTGLSGTELFNILNGRESVEIKVLPSENMDNYFRGYASMSGLTINSDTETPMSLSVNFTANKGISFLPVGTSGIAAITSDKLGYIIDTNFNVKLLNLATVENVCVSFDRDYIFALKEDSGLYKSTDGGDTFSLIQAMTMTTGTAVSYFVNCSSTGQYVFTFDNNNIYVSDDYGATFTTTALLAGKISVSPSGEYVSYYDGTNVYLSDDYGVSFANISVPAASGALLNIDVNDTGIIITCDSTKAYIYTTSWDAGSVVGTGTNWVSISDDTGYVAADNGVFKTTSFITPVYVISIASSVCSFVSAGKGNGYFSVISGEYVKFYLNDVLTTVLIKTTTSINTI